MQTKKFSSFAGVELYITPVHPPLPQDLLLHWSVSQKDMHMAWYSIDTIQDIREISESQYTQICFCFNIIILEIQTNWFQEQAAIPWILTVKMHTIIIGKTLKYNALTSKMELLPQYTTNPGSYICGSMLLPEKSRFQSRAYESPSLDGIGRGKSSRSFP